jgi:propanediol dehydratase medium subunit
MKQSINGLDHRHILEAILDGIRSQEVPARVIRVRHTSDCAFIGHAGAQLSGSGVAIGIQSKGTTVIHQKNLAPLDNLELFPQAPNLDLETYRQIGVNAAHYAQNKPTVPVPVKIDNTARLRLIVQTTLLHHQETEHVNRDAPPVELRIKVEEE